MRRAHNGGAQSIKGLRVNAAVRAHVKTGPDGQVHAGDGAQWSK
jgi:hypothetical protein